MNFYNIEKLRSYLVNFSVNYSISIALYSVFQINVSVVLGISSPLSVVAILAYNGYANYLFYTVLQCYNNHMVCKNYRFSSSKL